MKTSALKKTIFTIAVAALFIISGGSSAQTPHPILRYFKGEAINGQIRLSWVITGGNSCNGVIVERSSDGIFFQVLGDIAGICGSPDTDVPYTFTDEAPLTNQVNYYRLGLGGQGYSTPIAVNFVPLNDEGHNLRLDESQKSVTIFFSNPNKDLVDAGLFDVFGRACFTAQTTGSFINLPLIALPTGIYIFRISTPERIISGKFYKP